ncbi:MAG: helix-turn-helix transcriptional regulator [Saprospiraceae bacterium]|nr:helix-turn-helix transcriptional regulator [Saprospiraceae bacterium]
MSVKSLNNRILFGLFVKQLRQEKKLSFSDLAKASGMSVSYLNEIEKGKKYPKPEKLAALAKALNVTSLTLENQIFPQSLAPVKELLESNFLNELPLDLFGIELSKVAEIIANSPLRVGAFINTLVELSRNYALRESHFFFGALRAYQELNYNYFGDIEEAALTFSKGHQLENLDSIPVETLAGILEDDFGYDIVENGLDKYPEFKNMRSLFVPKQKKLLLQRGINRMQKAFQLGKEIGFNHLGLKDRSLTSSLLKVDNFDTVLTHATAAYFSVALLINLKRFTNDLEGFFSNEEWDGQAFMGLMKKYSAAPEMFFQRLTNVLPKKFGIKKLFFLRFLHDPSQDRFEIDKELHLHRKHHPHSNGLREHYCRRWMALTLLNELHEMESTGKYVGTIAGVQRSKFFGTEDEYLGFTVARPANPQSPYNVSLTLGMIIDEDLRSKIKFVDDPAIQVKEVNTTCERCPIEDCAERSAEPKIIRKRERRKAMLKRLQNLE